MYTLGEYGSLIPLADFEGLGESGINFGFPGTLPEQYKQHPALSKQEVVAVTPLDKSVRPTIPARIPIPRVPPKMPTTLPQPRPVVSKADETIDLPGRKLLWRRRVRRVRGKWGASLITRVVGRLKAKCAAQGGALDVEYLPGNWAVCSCRAKTYPKVEAVQQPAPPPAVAGKRAPASVAPKIAREHPGAAAVAAEPAEPGVAVAVAAAIPTPGIAAGAPGRPVATVREHPEAAAKAIVQAPAEGAAKAVERMHPEAAAKALERIHPEGAARVLERVHPKGVAKVMERMHPEGVAKVLERMHPEGAAKAVVRLHPAGAASALERMHPEGAAKVVARVHPAGAAKLLGRMHPAGAAKVRARAGLAKPVVPPRVRIKAGKLVYSCPAGYRKVQVGRAIKCVRPAVRGRARTVGGDW